MNQFGQYLRENKGKIAKRVLIGAAVVTTVVVVGALYKNHVDATAALEIAEDLAE